MSNDDLELRELYKTEAEHLLFDGLQFDDRLKERIMSGIEFESKPPSSVKGIIPCKDNPNMGIIMTSTPQSKDEAQLMFGEKLHLPVYVPQSYELQTEIVAYGTVEGVLDRVTFSYSTGARLIPRGSCERG
jgi:hypothetical protein